jgi:hypothetical protein
MTLLSETVAKKGYKKIKSAFNVTLFYFKFTLLLSREVLDDGICKTLTLGMLHMLGTCKLIHN